MEYIHPSATSGASDSTVPANRLATHAHLLPQELLIRRHAALVGVARPLSVNAHFTIPGYSMEQFPYTGAS